MEIYGDTHSVIISVQSRPIKSETCSMSQPRLQIWVGTQSTHKLNSSFNEFDKLFFKGKVEIKNLVLITSTTAVIKAAQELCGTDVVFEVYRRCRRASGTTS
jgi:hypothetical protein